MANAEERNTNRANAYRLLADCYQVPDRAEIETIGWLVSILGSLYSEGDDAALAMLKAWPRTEMQREALRVAHAKLFIGPFDLLAPPYGSVYLDEGRQVMGNSTMDAVNVYAKAGLDPSGDNHEPPDHITTELEFMYFLTYQHLTEGETKYLAWQREFLANHLSRWIPPFSSRIIMGNLNPFYNHLARLTAVFISAEAGGMDVAKGTKSQRVSFC